jgi:hypothetical protein
MTHEEAVTKAVKLLRLAQSNNEHEAALAMSRAQEIMDRYKLGNLSVETPTEPEESIQDFKADLLDAESTVIATWKWRLVKTLCRQNQCKAYSLTQWGDRGRVKGFALVGRASDVQTVRYFYGWLHKEILRISQPLCKGYGRNYALNFKIGMVETIVKNLEAARQATDSAVKQEAAQQGSMALMVLNTAIAKRDQQLVAVQTWVENNLRLRTFKSHVNQNLGARAAGRDAGERVRMRPSSGSLGSIRNQLT